MSSPQELHITFSHQAINYDVHLVKNGNSDHSVSINGVVYAVLGDEEKLKMASEILNSVSLDSISNVEDLSGRLSRRGDISFPQAQKTDEISKETFSSKSTIVSSQKFSIGEVIKGPIGVMMHNYLQSMAENAHFSGSVLVEKDNEMLLCAGYGLESNEAKNTPSTSFHIASITKQFTAAGILKLHEQEKIDLNAPINHYLPQQYHSEKWEKITIHQLLSHTAGITDYTDRPGYWDICNELTVDNVIHDVQNKELKFPPGTDFYYSNTGYLLLGKIIENLSGMSYGKYITQEILIPSGMNDSGVHDSTYIPLPNAAAPYHIGSNMELSEDTRNEFGVLYADGAMYSTTRDMAKWSHILDGKGDVLNPKSIELMITHRYGLRSDTILGHHCIHHNGSMAGFNANFVKYPESKILITVLGNNIDFPAYYITGSLSQQLFRPNQELASVVPFPKDFDYSPYLGTFNSEKLKERGGKFTFELNNGCLTLLGEKPTECFLLSNKRLLSINQSVEFELQKNGSLLVYDIYGAQIDTLSK